jgi:hypothetical protein
MNFSRKLLYDSPLSFINIIDHFKETSIGNTELIPVHSSQPLDTFASAHGHFTTGRFESPSTEAWIHWLSPHYIFMQQKVVSEREAQSPFVSEW